MLEAGGCHANRRCDPGYLHHGIRTAVHDRLSVLGALGFPYRVAGTVQ